MPDSPAVADKTDEKPLGLEVREKSFQQILKEQAETRNKSATETIAESEEDKAAKEKEAEEKKAADEAASKAKQEADNKAEAERQAEVAKLAAEEVIRKQEAEKQREADKLKAEAEAKQREEDLKPAWQKDPSAPKDKDGKPLPRSYEEIVAEGARIGEQKALERFREEQAKQEQARQAATEAEQKKQAEIKANRDAAEQRLQAQIDADLTDLYAQGRLPKIKDPKNEKDPGVVAQRQLFETAQKVNADLIAKGKPPIASLKLIFYEHYKAPAKPVDAPVLGSENTKVSEPDPLRYNVKTDRKKSMAQLVKEETARLLHKSGVRGR